MVVLVVGGVGVTCDRCSISGVCPRVSFVLFVWFALVVLVSWVVLGSGLSGLQAQWALHSGCVMSHRCRQLALVVVVVVVVWTVLFALVAVVALVALVRPLGPVDPAAQRTQGGPRGPWGGRIIILGGRINEHIGVIGWGIGA